MPKTRVYLSESQKREFCLYARQNDKLTRKEYVNWIERQWGIRVDDSTITRILKKSEEVLNAELTQPNAKRHKSVTVPELELALKEFVLVYQDTVILTDAILTEKAKQLADGFGIPDETLKFSAGWLQKFKERHGIRLRKLHGESSSVDTITITNALPLLKNICGTYPLERIYNMDETGLFYRLEPDHTLATRRLSGRKKDKERITIALCANADGSHKLDPLIIGKFAKPRCFANININSLPIMYRTNRKAWMLTTIFQEWLHEFSKQVARRHKNQRVLLLLDNCPSHKTEGVILSNVDIHFLPPNTTAKIQPMDAGIISSFKRHYRNLHIRWILSEIQKGKNIRDLKMNVLQAINYITKSWEEIMPLTISNCWKHTNILPTNVNVGPSELPCDSSPALSELAQMVTDLNLTDSMSLNEFLNNPEEDRVYEVPDKDKIIEDLVEIYREPSGVHVVDDSEADDSEADDSVELPIVNCSDAANSLEVVRSFLQQQEDSKELLKHINALDRYISLKSMDVMKQTTIDEFFNRQQ
jgi:hypothetical protein